MIIRGIKAGRRQSGFSLVAAIFVLVVLAMLGAFMVTIGAVQRTTVVQSLQAARAFQAAGAGIEWGIHHVVANGACPLPDPTVFTLTDPVLDGFQVSVSCTAAATPYQEGSNCFNVYHLQSFARLGAFNDPYFVSRQIEASVTDAPGVVCP